MVEIGKDLDDNNSCQKYVNYKGKLGCELVDMSTFITFIAKYIGWIMIIGGLIMTFYGANFIIHAITFIVSLCVTVMAFLALYNIGII